MLVLVFNVMVSTLRFWARPNKEQQPMQNIDETAQGPEMALVWTLLIGVSALAWLLPLLFK